MGEAAKVPFTTEARSARRNSRVKTKAKTESTTETPRHREDGGLQHGEHGAHGGKRAIVDQPSGAENFGTRRRRGLLMAAGVAVAVELQDPGARNLLESTCILHKAGTELLPSGGRDVDANGQNRSRSVVGGGRGKTGRIATASALLIRSAELRPIVLHCNPQALLPHIKLDRAE